MTYYVKAIDNNGGAEVELRFDADNDEYPFVVLSVVDDAGDGEEIAEYLVSEPGQVAELVKAATGAAGEFRALAK